MMYDIVIIGAGTAGMSAAVYGVRGGRSVLMIEELSYGGQIINTPEVDNYPGTGKVSGFELAQQMYEQATGLGAEMKYAKVTELKRDESGLFTVHTESDGDFQAKAVIVATGVKNRNLGLEREEALVGLGISYCATCDGAFFRGKKVAVMGGGNTALEDAEYLAALAEKVYVVHRRDQFRGDAITVERLKTKENVEFVLDSVPEKLIGEDRLTGVLIKNVKSGQERELEVDGVFVAYGHKAVNDVFAELADLDESGFFDSSEDCTTKTSGLFVAGDCRKKRRRQLLTAGSDGAVAAMTALDYLNTL